MAFTRTTQSAAAAPTLRKWTLSHAALLVPAGMATLFGAYALSHRLQVGYLIADALRSIRSSDLSVLNPTVYGIAGLTAFVMLLGLLRSAHILLNRLRDTTPATTRSWKPVEQFIEEAAAAKISLRVAREGYKLLEPHYLQLMCIDLSDSLRADLNLADEDIRMLGAQMFTRCDCHGAAGTSRDGKPLDLITVLDLLRRTETATSLRVDRSASRERITDLPHLVQMPEKRLSDSAQRKALHTATLHAIESGSMHVAGASEIRRRASDYEGPRRRATDSRVEAAYSGPYQRVTDDLSMMRPERRPDRPPVSSPERKAQPAADHATSKRCNPVLVAPFDARTSEMTRSGRPRT